jgi:hypothetical protein
MKLNFYGPINRQGVIKKVVADTFTDRSLTNRQQSYTVEVDPNTATPSDSFDYLENYEDF